MISWVAGAADKVAQKIDAVGPTVVKVAADTGVVVMAGTISFYQYVEGGMNLIILATGCAVGIGRLLLIIRDWRKKPKADE